MLNKNNFEIARLCPKPDEFTNYELSGIRVTPGGTETTDGHALLKVSGEGDQEKFAPFGLPAQVALKIAKALPSDSEIPTQDQAKIERIPDSNAVRISVTNQDADLDVYCARPMGGQFPDLNKVIPDVAEAAVEVLLDLDILIPLLQQVRGFHGNRNRRDKRWVPRRATFRFYNRKGSVNREPSYQPQRIDAKNDLGQELTAVIMPCRV